MIYLWNALVGYFSLSEHFVEMIKASYGLNDSWDRNLISIFSTSRTADRQLLTALFLRLSVWIFIEIIFPVLSILLSLGIAVKITSRLKESQFPESICVLETLRILIELERRDALIYPLQKKYLMLRMQYLASVNLLIPSNYPDNRFRKAWVNTQFKRGACHLCWPIRPLR